MANKGFCRFLAKKNKWTKEKEAACVKKGTGRKKK
jgi:hypothetical protein